MSTNPWYETLFEKSLLLLFLGLLNGATVHAQTPDILNIRKYSGQHASSLTREFLSFLSIPNIASNPDDRDRNIEFIKEMMEKRGIQHIQLLHPPSKSGPPAIYGEVMSGAPVTLVFYAHYDGQPVNPAQWDAGLEPFTPVVYTDDIRKKGRPLPVSALDSARDPHWRVYARGASDDKSGVIAILDAYQALTQCGLKPGCNLKFFFEGEEEAGSPHLGEVLQTYTPLLKSDLWIICDGPVHQSGKKQLFFGVRGATGLDLTVYASKRPLHSGHYGNWAPNPTMMLSKLLSSLKDESGKVLVKSFYDDVVPLGPVEMKALQESPPVDKAIMQELGIITSEMTGLSLNEAINLPALNIVGLQSGNVGKLASNQIPSWAKANIDLRQVLGNDWKKQQQKVIDHIQSQGYYVTTDEPTDEERRTYEKIIRIIPSDHGYNAQRTPMDAPLSQKVIEAVRSTTADTVVLQPTMGGSLPLYHIEKQLNAHVIIAPIANHDNNQHAENENIRLQNLFDGIETLSAIMMISYQ